MSTSPNPLAAREKDGPLAGLDSKYKYSSFIYPVNLGQPGAGLDHYVIFYINETSTTQFQTKYLNTNSDTVQSNGVILPDAAGDAPTIYANKQKDSLSVSRDREQPQGQQQSRGNGLYVPIHRVTTAIVLYMPEDVSVQYDAEWDVMEMGTTKNFADFVGGEGSKTDIFKSLGISIGKNLTDAASVATQLSLTDAASNRFRFAINPHLEAIFKGIGFRKFQFKFKFTPQSEREAENVYNIISAFKFYSAPEIKEGTGGRFWIYPAEFDIKFISHGKENTFVHKISTCALTGMNVNYTPTGQWVAHREHRWGGAPPVISTIDLQFTELEIMQKKRILEGY